MNNAFAGLISNQARAEEESVSLKRWQQRQPKPKFKEKKWEKKKE